MYHDTSDIEFVVVDNLGCDYTREFVESWVPNSKYVHYTGIIGTAAPRDLIFHVATGDIIMCIDSHIMLMPEGISKLIEFYSSNTNCMDLIQGVLCYDDLINISTHFEPIWRDHMWGTWATDERGKDINNEPFDIPMQGLGLFCCRKDAWQGFNSAFRGFGGEEGYIHEKFRQAGHRCLCAPWLRWVHRFGRPYGVAYPLNIEDRIYNYLVGHNELHLDLTPIFQHFVNYIDKSRLIEIANKSLGEHNYKKYFID